MKYSKRFNESSNYDITLPKGTVLYHGTIEDFDISNLTTGGYDNILWTAKDSAIADTYIPDSGSATYISTDSLVYPAREGDLRELQKKIGIEYDYSQIKFKGSRAISYPIAPIFKEIEEIEYRYNQEWSKVSTEHRNKNTEIRDLYNGVRTREDKENIQDKADRLHAEISELETEIEKYREGYNDIKAETKMREVVNNYLENELNYTTDKEGYDNNYNWKIKVNDGKVLKGDENAKGRLLIITLKRDFKIYDMTLGGLIEPDLMELQYHSHGAFKSAKEKGYDGIKINDFAQIEGMGNFGHKSFGLFDNVIKDLDIKSIESQHPSNFHDDHFMSRNYVSMSLR